MTSKKPRVLIVDDEKVIGDLLHAGLSERGYLCTTVLSGNEALAKLAIKDFDAVLLDIKLPKMSGMEVLREIWLNYVDTATIIITNNVDTAAAAKKSGASDSIVKSFDFDGIDTRIRAALKAIKETRSEQAANRIPSLNIMLTNTCPNRCKYCFAPLSDIGGDNTKAEFISVDDFRFVLDFLKRSGHRSVRLLGGEPLIHPDIELFLHEINMEDQFEDIIIFTGGIFAPRRIKYLEGGKVKVVVNTNHPKDYTPHLYRRFISNLEAMADKGIEFSLGFNIYEPDFDGAPILELAANLGARGLRLCIACPTTTGDTAYLSLEQQKEMGHRLYSLLSDCASKSIQVGFDCVVPACVFTVEEWASVVRMFPDIENCSVCNPCLDVDTKLRVFRCFAIRDSSVALRDFSSSAELWDYFYQQVDAFKWHASDKECLDCEYGLTKLCHGGCIAPYWSKIVDLQNGKEKTRGIFDEAYRHLKSNNFEAAVAKFEQGLESYPLDPDIIRDYISALRKSSHIDKADQALDFYERTLMMGLELGSKQSLGTSIQYQKRVSKILKHLLISSRY